MAFLNLNNLSVYYEVHGQGRPIVLVHGALVDSRMWQPQIEPFAERYQVITYDARGHGKTGGSPRRRYTVQFFAQDLRDLICALRLERPIICGLSLGGMVGQAYAASYPDELSALILSDSAVSTTLTTSDRLQTYLFGWSLAPSVRLIGARRFVYWSFLAARLLHGEAWFGQNAAVQQYVRNAMSDLETAEMAKIYDAVVGFREVDLAHIKVPALILNGEHESASVFRHAEYMRERIPNAEMDVIPGAGHVSNMENPEDFTRKVLAFLDVRGTH